MKDDREVERVLTEWLITQNTDLNQQGGKKGSPVRRCFIHGRYYCVEKQWNRSTTGYELFLLELRMKEPEYTYAYCNLCYKHSVG